jgi:hypothetical protein
VGQLSPLQRTRDQKIPGRALFTTSRKETKSKKQNDSFTTHHLTYLFESQHLHYELCIFFLEVHTTLRFLVAIYP